MQIHRLKDKDFVDAQTGDGGGKLAIYVTTPNVAVAFVRFEKDTPLGALRNWPYWYDEVLYVTRGKGRITYSFQPFLTSEVHELQVGDLFFVPKGSKATIEALSEEPFELLTVMHPSPIEG